MKSLPKRLEQQKQQFADQHHTSAPEKLTRLRRIASVSGTRIVRYQCLCCEPHTTATQKRVKASQRFKVATV